MPQPKPTTRPKLDLKPVEPPKEEAPAKSQHVNVPDDFILNWKMTPRMFQAILNVLGEAPYKVSAPIIEDGRAQMEQQLQERK